MFECIVALPALTDNLLVVAISDVVKLALLEHQLGPLEPLQDDFQDVVAGKLRHRADVKAIILMLIRILVVDVECQLLKRRVHKVLEDQKLCPSFILSPGTLLDLLLSLFFLL